MGSGDVAPAMDGFAGIWNDHRKNLISSMRSLGKMAALAAVPEVSRDKLMPYRIGQADRWLIATFSTAGDGDPEGDFAKLLVGLCDAILLTFRWTT